MEQPRLLLGHHGPLRRIPYWLGPEDTAFHKHVIGLTKQGKSKFIAQLCLQFWKQGVPFALLDPHTDLADELLALLADQGIFSSPTVGERLWYLDFNRTDRFLPFNVLNQTINGVPLPPHKVAEQLVEVCRRVWPALADGNAPMFENMVRQTAKVLIANHLPVTELPRVISNKAYRDKLLVNVDNIRVREFFTDNFDRLVPRDQLEQVQSTRRRIDLLTDAPQLLYSMGQVDNTLNFRAIMDHKVSLICNLGGKDTTLDTQKFIGAFLMHGLEEAAFSRAEPGSPRNDFHLIIDEFDRFSTHAESAMTDMLSQTRKYGLYLTMAHQTWSQVSERLQGALQNTVHIAFKLGRRDAEWMADELLDVNPHTTSHREGQDTEGEGMREQLRDFSQKLSGLHKGYAMVKAMTQTRRQKLLRIHPEPTKVHILRVPKTQTTPEELQEIKDRYARMLMRPLSEIAPVIDTPLTEALPSAKPPPGSSA